MIRVECTNGDERELEPKEFELADRTVAVEEVIDRWYGNTYTYFKVRAADGHIYILKHHRLSGEWELHFTETDVPTPASPSWPFTRSSSPRLN